MRPISNKVHSLSKSSRGKGSSSIKSKDNAFSNSKIGIKNKGKIQVVPQPGSNSRLEKIHLSGSRIVAIVKLEEVKDHLAAVKPPAVVKDHLAPVNGPAQENSAADAPVVVEENSAAAGVLAADAEADRVPFDNRAARTVSTVLSISSTLVNVTGP